jgi:hypothetical protein
VSKTEQFPPLSVDADLTLTVEGHEYTVRDRDDVLVVEAPTLPAALTLLDSLPDADGVGRLVSRTGLVVEIRVRDAVVATAGRDVDGGVLTRSVGVPTALDTGGVARALGREARARPGTVLALVAAVVAVAWLVGRARGHDD